MYRALQSYKGAESDMLTFSEGDEFNLIEEYDQHWWFMQNGKGETGLVPSSYLQVNQVVKEEVLESIDRAISLIHKRAAEMGGPMPTSERKNLQKLINHRKTIVADDSMWKSGMRKSSSHKAQKAPIPQQPNRPAPQPPGAMKKVASIKSRKAPEPPSRNQSLDAVQSGPTGLINDDFISSVSKASVPESFGADVIESLSYRFGLKAETAQAIAMCVCSEIGDAIQPVKLLMHHIEDNIRKSEQAVEALNAEVENEDIVKVRKILDDLTERKEDSQQRGWAIQEDYHAINGLLEDLIQFAASGDKKVTIKLLAEDDYRYLHNLVVYYQMETRRKLRTTMLQLFGCLCQLKKDHVSQLLYSILPTELGLDLMREKEDIVHLLSTSLLMTMLFSTGESVPYTHYAQLDRDFVKFLLQGIENSFEIDEEDQIPDSFVGLLLSFNQHFSAGMQFKWELFEAAVHKIKPMLSLLVQDPSKNLVMSVLAEGDSIRVFSEKIMMLINREEDPAAMFDYYKAFPDSVLKIFTDIFSSKETSKIFFTNDLMVLLDIVLRQMTDREAGDKMRTEYLSLFYNILLTTDYKDHSYRLDEFKRCFRAVQIDEHEEVEADKYIIREIQSAFPDLFK